MWKYGEKEEEKKKKKAVQKWFSSIFHMGLRESVRPGLGWSVASDNTACVFTFLPHGNVHACRATVPKRNITVNLSWSSDTSILHVHASQSGTPHPPFPDWLCTSSETCFLSFINIYDQRRKKKPTSRHLRALFLQRQRGISSQKLICETDKALILQPSI